MSTAQVTIKDLARQLNISVSTVSRALRNAPDINPGTKNAVLKLAAELSYEPNVMAQGLVKKKTKIIGVVVPAIHSNYFSDALSGMTEVANAYDYHLMFCQSNEDAGQEIRSIKKLLACHVDGLLISVSKDTKNTAEFEKVKQLGVPVVMFDRTLPDFTCSKVIVDEYEGAFKAVEHLIRKGCKRIAHLAGPVNASVSANRMKGYIDALAKYGLPVNDKLILRCNAFEEDALPAIKKIIASRPMPDGIFFINDLSAISAIQYMQKKGINVPGDIKVAGFNDDPVSAVIQPSLTTVMQPSYEVGKLAIGILIDAILKPESPEQTISLRTKLVIRDSTK
ncbi:MAG: LacI family DNA-binding transcriptional regulator [Chitinophagaceae bacterium]|nr:LacI family DNA-binding transcriptional regulator [Chitinophagaceae bacterium]